jgi:hypothetical protein
MAEKGCSSLSRNSHDPDYRYIAYLAYCCGFHGVDCQPILEVKKWLFEVFKLVLRHCVAKTQSMLMTFLLFVIQLLTVPTVLGFLYQVVRVEQTDDTYLVLKKIIAKKINDTDSITTLGFDPANLETITLAALSKMRIGAPVPLMKYYDRSPDELTRIEILKSRAIVGDLLYDMHHIGEYMNPAVLKWQDRLIMMTGSNDGRANSKFTKQALLEFRWLNDSSYPFFESDEYLGVVTGEVERLNLEVFGEDPRVVSIDADTFHVYYAYPFQPLTRIGMLRVFLNRTSMRTEVGEFYSSIDPVLQWNIRHKNWSPFLQHGTKDVLLVQSINPLFIVKPVFRPEINSLRAEVVSTGEEIKLFWPYGTLRGGTNAIYLEQQGVYLSFFHSKGNIPGNYMYTYFIGAYTFSGSAPHRLVSISPAPIMPEMFYTGPWSPMKNAKIDYCLFPTAIFLQEGSNSSGMGVGEEIFMSLGFQDHSGYTAMVNLQTLLDSLAPL